MDWVFDSIEVNSVLIIYHQSLVRYFRLHGSIETRGKAGLGSASLTADLLQGRAQGSVSSDQVCSALKDIPYPRPFRSSACRQI